MHKGLHYRNIFESEHEPARDPAERIMRFVHDPLSDLRQQIGLSGDFPEQFFQLLDIMKEDFSTKRLIDTGHTNLYPQRPRFTKLVNWGIIYSAVVFYFLVRLTLVAVAFSSLRMMPDSVYVTSWTAYIPAIQ